MSSETNPLLSDDFRIPFHRIRAEHVEPGVRRALQEAEAEVDAIAADRSPATWRNTLGRLDAATDRLARRIAPAAHLVAVAETPPLREAYNAVLPEMSEFWSRLPLNSELWGRIKAFAATEAARSLTGIERRHLDKTVREFERAGADLPEREKQRLADIRVQLARIEQKFSENVLDATAAFELRVEDRARLQGVPEPALRRARRKAEEKGLDGWLLTLDYPSVEPILKHCEDRALRREIHAAYVSRCRGGEHDNRSLIVRILVLRDELAHILGYERFSDYKLEDRMARTGQRAAEFERDLVERTRPYWTRDLDELRRHAAVLGLDGLEPWDVAYVTEKLRKERYDLDDELLRPYFPIEGVLAGLFDVVERAFGFRVQERKIEEVWHADVRYYELLDEAGMVVGAFYADWFPRKEKRGGAWMNDLITGGPRERGFEPHLGVVCGNFTPPDGDFPSLLTHREVMTAFHEFGHLLHHCASRVPIPSRAGINVAWDWVELPSQLMENWTWERDALDLFARHHESGEPLPDQLYERMQAARRFGSGLQQMRQLSFGTVDLLLHDDLAPLLRARATGETDGAQADTVMSFARDAFLPFVPAPSFAEGHSLTSFTHLFSGGYAAGYYSYLWSEVLDADVFTRFQREGVFNRETGRAYVDTILSRGDSADPDELFREFMGRDPDPGALLERNLGPPPK